MGILGYFRPAGEPRRRFDSERQAIFVAGGIRRASFSRQGHFLFAERLADSR
jgi:hypothetical protein